jgi:hypothetical protein
MLVSPATVTRVNGEGLDEHAAAKTSSKIESIAKEMRRHAVNLDVKTFIMVFSFWGMLVKSALAERLDCCNPALFRADPSKKETEKRKESMAR